MESNFLTADKPHTRLIKKQVKSNQDLRKAFFVLLGAIVGFIFLTGFTTTFVQASISEINYQVNSTSNQNEKIKLENEKLKSQIASLESLDRIEQYAMEELNMCHCAEVEHMVLSSEIVEEGKIKAVEIIETPEEPRPMAAVVSFLLAWK